MALCRIILLTVLAGVFATPVQRADFFSPYDTARIIALNGYPSETHHVTTNDGYILEIHRIPHGRNQAPSDRPVVFLMHGLTAASNSYIILGPELSPAYNLADAGFDVWMGNARGNRNSRAHVRLNPDDDKEKLEFFDFSFEEIALIDLPTMMDYALKFTEKEQLHYIGHSQGGTTFLILNSMMPEYNKKIASAHLFAGVGYMNHFPYGELVAAARITDIIYNLAVNMGIVEIFPPGYGEDSDLETRAARCTGDVRTAKVCEMMGMQHLLSAVTNTEQSTSRSILDNLDLGIDSSVLESSAGAALKQFAHYGQNIRDKSFRRWSYNAFRNLREYGTRDPPEYDLSKINIKVTMHYTVNDALLDERDVLAMAKDMPNTSVRKVARDTFLHEEFVTARDAKELVTDYVIEELKRDCGMTL